MLTRVIVTVDDEVQSIKHQYVGVDRYCVYVFGMCKLFVLQNEMEGARLPGSAGHRTSSGLLNTR
jgi:hypothetical protein